MPEESATVTGPGRMGAGDPADRAADAAIVDSHVHLLPGRIGEKVRAVFQTGVDNGSFALAYPHGHHDVLDRLADEGVGTVWSLPYAHKPGVASGLNAASAETVRQFAPHRITVTGGATVHPGDDDPAAIVEHAVDVLGLRVLKLHCSVGSFDADDPRLDGAYRAAAERHLPVVVHLGHNHNGLTEKDEIESIARVCRAHPGLPVILAHYGHHSAPDADPLFERFANFHADLTPVVTAAPNVTQEMLQSHGDRILFGSDAPNTAVTVTRHVEWLDGFGLTDDVRAAILGGNARRLSAAVGR